MIRLLLAFLLLQTAPAQQPANLSPDDLLKEQVPAATARLSYGPGELQFGELRIPAGQGPYPVAILVHGGCYANRLPGLDPRATSLDLLRPMAAALADSGFATWNVEYRRAGDDGGGWPGTFLDLGRAADFLRTIAPKYGLDLKRVVAVGHSSGGQLALWLAARPRLAATSPIYMSNPLPLAGAADIDGPIDPSSVQPREKEFCDIPAVTQFLGGSPGEQPQRYHDATIASFLPTGVPQVVIAGALSQRMPDPLNTYAVAAKAAGEHLTVVALNKSGHFDMLSPHTKYWRVVNEYIWSLLH